MKITVRWQAKVFTVEVNDEATGEDLKQEIMKIQNLGEGQQIRIIFSGKIVQDKVKLSEINLKDEGVVHMVVSSKPKPAAPAPAPAASEQSTPQPAAAGPTAAPLPDMPPPAANPFGFMGMGGMGGLPGMPNMNDPAMMQAAQQMMSNPEMMQAAQTLASDPSMMQHMMGAMSGNMADVQAMMSSPAIQQMMQSMMSNPDALAQMVRSNPMLANNPQLSGMLSDPDALRQQMEAAQAMLGGNPLGALFGNMANPNAQNPNAPNAGAPSAPSSASPSSAGSAASAPSAPSAPPFNPMAAMFGGFNPFQAPAIDFNQCLLLQMLQQGSMTPDADAALRNSEVQRGLNYIAKGINLCRKNGLRLFNTVPGIDNLQERPEMPMPMPMPFMAAPAPAGQATGAQTSGQTAEVPQMSPQERFGPQLEQLRQLGFTDEQKNVEALTASMGNVERAVDYILSH